jgi:hypothetical protein
VGPIAPHPRGLGWSISRKEEPRWRAALLFRLQIDVMHHAGVVHLSMVPHRPPAESFDIVSQYQIGEDRHPLIEQLYLFLSTFSGTPSQIL